MASKQLQRLRTLQDEAAAIYHNYQEPGAQLRASLRAYGGKGEPTRRELQRRVGVHQTELFALRKQALQDAASIKAKTVRKVAVSESSKNDVRAMSAAGASPHQICEWILETGRADGFAALREIVTQEAFVQPGQQRPQAIIAEAEKVIGSFEQRTFTPEEAAAAEEAREVQASMNFLIGNLDRLDDYFELQLSDTAWRGNLPSVEKLSKWPGLPGSEQAALLNEGVSIPLESVK